MTGASSWSFGEQDSQRISAILDDFLAQANARTALIVDKTGQMVATVGQTPSFDSTAFASLTAADFSANDQLAKMVGEAEFGSLFHQGEKESLYLADIAGRVILVVLFDRSTTLGLVKLRVKPTIVALNEVFMQMLARDDDQASRMESDFVGDAEDEIDRLFGG